MWLSLLKAIPSLVGIALEIAKWIAELQKQGRLKEVKTLMQGVDNAKTEEEKAAIAKRISEFWANPK